MVITLSSRLIHNRGFGRFEMIHGEMWVWTEALAWSLPGFVAVRRSESWLAGFKMGDSWNIFHGHCCECVIFTKVGSWENIWIFFWKLDERSHSICHNNFITTSQFIGADLLRVVKRMPPEEVGVLSTVCREPVVLPRKKRGLLKQRL